MATIELEKRSGVCSTNGNKMLWIFMAKYLKSLSICKSSSSLLLERSLELTKQSVHTVLQNFKSNLDLIFSLQMSKYISQLCMWEIILGQNYVWQKVTAY